MIGFSELELKQSGRELTGKTSVMGNIYHIP